MKKIILSTSLILILISTISFSQEQLLNIKSNRWVNFEAKETILQDDNFKKKSAGLAILYSILIPGMGELYVGDYSTGKYFTIADGIIWSTFAGMTIYGNNKEDDYRAFAKAYGGVNLNDKDDEYFANIGIYENIEKFNRERELNRQFDEVYEVVNDYWAWNSPEQRKEYRGLWTSSENAKNNIRFTVGALVLNRIVSAIFAVRAVSTYNKKENISRNWDINFGLEKSIFFSKQFTMNFKYSF